MRRVGWALALCLFAALSARAEVSLKTGAYYVGFNDLTYEGGFPLELERTYNSRTSFRGVFGWGWGSSLEYRLLAEHDGSVVIEEYGGGTRNRFQPNDITAERIDSDIKLIIDRQVRFGAFNSKTELDAYTLKLKNDPELRAKEWNRMAGLGRLEKRDHPGGTTFRSAQYPEEWIESLGTQGFTRHRKDGRVDRFDSKGRLIRVDLKNGAFIEFTYSPEGHITRLIDQLSRKVFFKMNSEGQITRIDAESNLFAEYRYNDAGELIWSRDARGNTYSYQYDRNRRHNLVEIRFPDRKTEKIAYYPPNEGNRFGEAVQTLKLRNGERRVYDWIIDPKDSDHQTVKVSILPKGSKKKRTQQIEHFFKHKADGTRWLFRVAETTGSGPTLLREETTLNECCGMPLSIRRGNKETNFHYDTQGNLIRKITTKAVIEYTYDPKLRKVTRVARYPKALVGKKAAQWAEYRYDGAGNLIFARNSDGRGVRVFYNSIGQPIAMFDHLKRKIHLKYDTLGRPVEIRDPSRGVVTLRYWATGELREAKSTRGVRSAAQIYTFYESLRELLSGAQASLTF